VVFIFSVLAMIAAYGCSQVSIEFDFGYFLTDTDMAAYKFFETAKKYDMTPFTDSNIFFLLARHKL